MMPPIWKPQEPEVYQEWIEKLENEDNWSKPLTSWECDFIISLKGQLVYRNLSQKQADILERIYSEKTK